MLKNYIEEALTTKAENSDYGRYYQTEVEAYSPEEKLTAVIKITIDNDMRYIPATYDEPDDIRGKITVTVDEIVVCDEDGNEVDYGLNPKDFDFELEP